jgi:hypothetical protein
VNFFAPAIEIEHGIFSRCSLIISRNCNKHAINNSASAQHQFYFCDFSHDYLKTHSQKNNFSDSNCHQPSINEIFQTQCNPLHCAVRTIWKGVLKLARKPSQRATPSLAPFDSSDQFIAGIDRQGHR